MVFPRHDSLVFNMGMVHILLHRGDPAVRAFLSLFSFSRGDRRRMPCKVYVGVSIHVRQVSMCTLILSFPGKSYWHEGFETAESIKKEAKRGSEREREMKRGSLVG